MLKILNPNMQGREEAARARPKPVQDFLRDHFNSSIPKAARFSKTATSVEKAAIVRKRKKRKRKN